MKRILLLPFITVLMGSTSCFAHGCYYFLQLDTSKTTLVEKHASVDSSFTLEGYVTPGSELQFRVGYGYLADSWKGINGCYHYGEFILKRITITWLQSGE